MTRRDEPVEIGEILDALAGRIKRVDLRLIDEVRSLWERVVDPALASSCRPLIVRDGTLVVGVPSGAYAQRVEEEGPTILQGLAELGERAPHTIQTRVQGR